MGIYGSDLASNVKETNSGCWPLCLGTKALKKSSHCSSVVFVFFIVIFK